jgi:hypothetical protein
VLALAVRDLHPLDSIKGFSPSHLRFLPFHAFSQRDNDVDRVKSFLFFFSLFFCTCPHPICSRHLALQFGA